MAENQYIYAVSRIRSKELSLLDKSFLEQLLSSKSYHDCLRLLTDKGWGLGNNETAEELLHIERDKTWDLIRELVEDMSVFDTFLYGNDFHNLKAAIKQVYRNEEVPNIYISHGTIKPEIIYNAVKEHDFSTLPEYMKQCAEEAYQVQLHTGDSQLCDVIIDRASLDTIYKKGKDSGNELLSEYAELKVAASNINIAIRGFKTKKGIEFLERAMAKCGSLDRDQLMNAALDSEEAIYDYLSTTVYSEAVQAIKESPSAFERWCDNVIMQHIKPQKYNSFTISPLAAYILARENEIKTVRIILSGKLNDLPENLVRERLREMYV
jgi:V/A-type H+/Na+-transporting ATPase subunit C